MNEEKFKRGGSRPGAGRKPGSGKGRTVTTRSISFPNDLLPRITMAADREGLSLAAWVSRAAESALDPTPAVSPVLPSAAQRTTPDRPRGSPGSASPTA